MRHRYKTRDSDSSSSDSDCCSRSKPNRYSDSSSDSSSSDSSSSDSSSSDSSSSDDCSKSRRWRSHRKPKNALFSAVRKNNIRLVKKLIDQDHDINQTDDCDIDILMTAVRHDHLNIFKFLLGHPLFKISQDDIRYVILYDIQYIRWLLVISQPEKIKDETLKILRDTLGIAYESLDEIKLLISYNETQNREQTLNKIRRDLGMVEDLFSLVVLNTDEYLKNKAKKDVKRYFRILKQLPMELQMLICHRVYESPMDNITGEKVDQSLKRVVNWFN
jgi:phosphopantetheine adenylyltransferase